MRRTVGLPAAALILTVLLGACGGETATSSAPPAATAPNWSDLSFDRTMELDYAQEFSVRYCGEDYKLIGIDGEDQRLLVVAEGAPVPAGLEEDITVLQQPLDQIYLAATAGMDYFRQLGAIGDITLSSQKESGWYIPEARDAMEAGTMQYAGKYSAPDYERILSQGCDLAIENTMIYHTPEVKEQLEELGIPVLVERSSYESDPLGRMEWLKFFAALVDEEDQADAYFDQLTDELSGVIGQAPADRTVAFFYVTSNGAVNVRRSGDYVAKSIALAGGTYLSFDDLEDGDARSTMTIQMETFYAGAQDADLLIYNSTIDGELQSLDQLLAKSPLLADLKAVQAGNVWCVSKNFYQESLELGDMILDVHAILTDPAVDDSRLHFLYRLT